MKRVYTYTVSDDRLVCRRIHRHTASRMSFWKSAHGWAPISAANLLNRSALEWQVSLAESLTRWVGRTLEGDLILAWANLSALVEGQLKLFLSVYYHDYKKDVKDSQNRPVHGFSIFLLKPYLISRLFLQDLIFKLLDDAELNFLFQISNCIFH
jgi:hypothetical protein